MSYIPMNVVHTRRILILITVGVRALLLSNEQLQFYFACARHSMSNDKTCSRRKLCYI